MADRVVMVDIVVMVDQKEIWQKKMLPKFSYSQKICLTEHLFLKKYKKWTDLFGTTFLIWLEMNNDGGNQVPNVRKPSDQSQILARSARKFKFYIKYFCL